MKHPSRTQLPDMEDDTRREYLADAIKCLNAQIDEEGLYVYYDDTTRSYWRNDEDDMVRFGWMMSGDGEAYEPSSTYSHWCAETCAEHVETMTFHGCFAKS